MLILPILLDGLQNQTGSDCRVLLEDLSRHDSSPLNLLISILFLPNVNMAVAAADMLGNFPGRPMAAVTALAEVTTTHQD